jgi:methylthioribulose-1-phosphate dehydratase
MPDAGSADDTAGAAITALADGLIAAARDFHGRGYSPATSSNYSARVDATSALITVSGRDKGALTREDFLRVDLDGQPLSAGKPSAETLLHTLMYQRDADIGCVLHTHSPRGVVLSKLVTGRKLDLEGWELQKAFTGIETHDCTIRVPIFDNDQDMAKLARCIDVRLPTSIPCFGFLLRGHGLYAWGRDIATAARHVEAFEYLFECELALRLRR